MYLSKIVVYKLWSTSKRMHTNLQRVICSPRLNGWGNCPSQVRQRRQNRSRICAAIIKAQVDKARFRAIIRVLYYTDEDQAEAKVRRKEKGQRHDHKQGPFRGPLKDCDQDDDRQSHTELVQRSRALEQQWQRQETYNSILIKLNLKFWKRVPYIFGTKTTLYLTKRIP